MRPWGPVIIVATMLFPLTLFWALAAKHDPVALFSQYAGAAALIAMAWTQVLAMRIRLFEGFFGGLDQMYRVHKWLGIGAVLAILLHDTIDAEVKTAGGQSLLEEAAETLGELSLYGILALVVLSVVTFVPYHLWRWTHKLMGGFFAAGLLHFAFIQKPFANGDLLGLYVLAFCLVGLVAYAYTLVPLGMLRLRHRYAVTAVEAIADTTVVTLAPKGRGIRHRAGQFAFLAFPGLGHREAHPFTISAAPGEDRALQFSMKSLGDGTRALTRQIAVGGDVLLSSAYGQFRPSTRAPQIWIAGGIGITPFVAWAGTELKAPAHLFYCVRTAEEALHLETLRANPQITVHLIESSKAGRLTAEQIVAATGADLKAAHVFFCGAEPMRETLRAQLIGLGLRRGRFHAEAFEIRSGFGVRKLFACVIAWWARRPSKTL